MSNETCKIHMCAHPHSLIMSFDFRYLDPEQFNYCVREQEIGCLNNKGLYIFLFSLYFPAIRFERLESKSLINLIFRLNISA